jgi:hypothetical protein
VIYQKKKSQLIDGSFKTLKNKIKPEDKKRNKFSNDLIVFPLIIVFVSFLFTFSTVLYQVFPVFLFFFSIFFFFFFVCP